MTRAAFYIHEGADWPHFTYDHAVLSRPLAALHARRGALTGMMRTYDRHARLSQQVDTLTADVRHSSLIEGEHLPEPEVYSSVARRLGFEAGGLVESARTLDGVVDMTLDATQRFDRPVTEERLYGWHAALFPTGYSAGVRIRVGEWRRDEEGPMQVVSKHLDPAHRRVYFEAPDAARLPAEMPAFLAWLEGEQPHDPVIKAGLAHLYFLTLHPFEDGNGRVARALTDLMLARTEGQSERYFSLSWAIEAQRASYYRVLSETQAGPALDVTPWLSWFLARLDEAIGHAQRQLDLVRAKYGYLRDVAGVLGLSARQSAFLQRVFTGFDGKLSNKKYAHMFGVSPDTALRDLSELVEAGLLVRTGEGRGVRYLVPLPEEGAELIALYPDVFTLR